MARKIQVSLAFIVRPEDFDESDRAPYNGNDEAFARSVVVDYLESAGAIYDYAEEMRLIGVKTLPDDAEGEGEAL